jgi:hypothetical protein
MPNITQIPAPRVNIVDEKTGLISREWFRFLNNVYTIVGGENRGVILPENGGTGTDAIPANGQIPIGDGTTYTPANLTQGAGLTITNGAGSVALAITNTGVTAGSYGSASAVPNYSVNAQGQLTAAANTSIAIDASQVTSGIFPIARGGTNTNATPTAGTVAYGTGTAVAYSAVGTAGQALVSNGASAPSWSTIPSSQWTTTISGVDIYYTTGNVGIGTSTPGSTLDVKGILRLSGSFSGYVGFVAPAAVASSITYTLPSVAGTANQVLQTNGSGVLSWASVGVGTVTSVSGTGTVSGLSLSGTVTSSGNLTLGGAISLVFGDVTSALGYVPYPNTNPSGFVNSSGSVAFATSAGSASTATNLSGGTLTTSSYLLSSSSSLVAIGNSSGQGVFVNGSGSFSSSVDNTMSCGTSGFRWTTVYATTGTINTSDANQKQQIQNLTDVELAVATELKSKVKTFKFNDAVTAKGLNARKHVGWIAQDVQTAFANHGLNANDYGLFCSDEIDGKIQLGVRYEELLTFISAAEDQKMTALISSVNQLAAEVEALKSSQPPK